MPLPDPSCEGCPGADLGVGFVPPDKVTQHTRLAIFGESPGQDEIAGVPPRGYVGPSGRVLRRQERAAGLAVWSAWPREPKPSFEEVAHFNVTQCRPPGNQFLGEVTALRCMERHKQLELAEGLPMLATGANAIEALTGYRLDPLTIRGSILPRRGGGWVTATYHPALLLYGKDDQTLGKGMDQLEPLLAQDIRRALVVKEPYVPQVRVDLTGEEALAAWEAAKPTGLCAVDVEGSGGAPNVLGVGWVRGEAWTMPWTPAAKELITRVFASALPLFHNAEYDIPEICATGVPEPPRWADSINTAALVDPDLRKGLQAQVLSWVLGSLAWKGLVAHSGPTGDKHHLWRAIWTEVLARLGRYVPQSDSEFMFFYNGLDVAWSFDLFRNHQAILTPQGRWTYYLAVQQPLQKPLLDMGRRGIPADPERFALHRRACERLVRMAQRILTPAAAEMLREEVEPLQNKVAAYEAVRDVEKASGTRAFSEAEAFAALKAKAATLTEEVAGYIIRRLETAAKSISHPAREKVGGFSYADELTKLRGKLRTREAAIEKGFNFDSVPQRKALLYEWYGLPEVTTGKGKDSHVTTGDDAIASLILRMTKTDPFDEDGKVAKVLKPKRGTVAEVARVLVALVAGKKWRTWTSGFLRPEWESPKSEDQKMHSVPEAQENRGLSPATASVQEVRLPEIQGVPREVSKGQQGSALRAPEADPPSAVEERPGIRPRTGACELPEEPGGEESAASRTSAAPTHPRKDSPVEDRQRCPLGELEAPQAVREVWGEERTASCSSPGLQEAQGNNLAVPSLSSASPLRRRPRIATSYSQSSAVTGRLSSGVETSDPEKTSVTGRKVAHVQNIPRKLRDAFVADPGYAMVSADWSSLQWAICMYYSAKFDTDGFHTSLLDRQQAGELDPHRFLAAAVYQCSEEAVTSEQRRTAKAYTFGRMFLGSERGLARSAGHRDSVGLRVCAVHDKAYRLGEWQKSMLHGAKMKGYIQTPLGWRQYHRGWNLKPSEVLAGIIQATEADLLKWVFSRMAAACPAAWELLTSTHDSVLMQAPPSEAEEAKTWLLGQMQQPIPWLDGRTWRAAAKIGPNWRAVS